MHSFRALMYPRGSGQGRKCNFRALAYRRGADRAPLGPAFSARRGARPRGAGRPRPSRLGFSSGVRASVARRPAPGLAFPTRGPAAGIHESPRSALLPLAAAAEIHERPENALSCSPLLLRRLHWPPARRPPRPAAPRLSPSPRPSRATPALATCAPCVHHPRPRRHPAWEAHGLPAGHSQLRGSLRKWGLSLEREMRETEHGKMGTRSAMPASGTRPGPAIEEARTPWDFSTA